MKKTSTTYKIFHDIFLTVDEESAGHVSIHEYGEPCSGILKHWNDINGHIAELGMIIHELKKFQHEEK